ncbi:uncharacterized protein LOC131941221 [Physella acuta]|uniref:uncharacterized protein LOC131941221 n=1 Tax=Physella acuta TaxID=109671 RepID=UPI0027DDF3EB|nr:uncharacterized protein LOC131941221 [Physella acuta]
MSSEQAGVDLEIDVADLSTSSADIILHVSKSQQDSKSELAATDVASNAADVVSNAADVNLGGGDHTNDLEAITLFYQDAIVKISIFIDYTRKVVPSACRRLCRLSCRYGYFLFPFWYCYWYLLEPTEMPSKLEYTIVRLLPWIFLIETARHVLQISPRHYRYVQVGLLLCASGDVVIIWFKSRMLLSVFLMCVGHLSYTIGLFQHYKASLYIRIVYPFNFMTFAALIYVAGATVVTMSVIAVTLFVTVVSYFVVSGERNFQKRSCFLGLAGVNLFLLSDMLLLMREPTPQPERPAPAPVPAPVGWTHYVNWLMDDDLLNKLMTLKFGPPDLVNK